MNENCWLVKEGLNRDNSMIIHSLGILPFIVKAPKEHEVVIVVFYASTFNLFLQCSIVAEVC